jgi:hypothetical protein
MKILKGKKYKLGEFVYDARNCSLYEINDLGKKRVAIANSNMYYQVYYILDIETNKIKEMPVDTLDWNKDVNGILLDRTPPTVNDIYERNNRLYYCVVVRFDTEENRVYYKKLNSDESLLNIEVGSFNALFRSSAKSDTKI